MADIIAVHKSPDRGIQKQTQSEITLVAGLGVKGDVHFGEHIRHQSRLVRQAGHPNTRQLHLIGIELIEELKERGFDLSPGAMGENITTRGVDLLSLSPGARLRLGQDAVIEITGLRNPCQQLDGLQSGLMAALLGRDETGQLVRRGGVMAIIITGGAVKAGDLIELSDPGRVGAALQPV